LNYVSTGKAVCILFLVLLAGTLFSCARKPLVQVTGQCTPTFTDDADRNALKQAVRQNLAYLSRQPSDQQITLADHIFPVTRLSRSLEFFLAILDANLSDADLDGKIKENFDIYQATGTGGFNPRRKMLVTGYFQPLIDGSLVREGEFRYPLYSVPDDLVQQDSSTGSRTIGRLDKGSLVPYWTRGQIEQLGKAAGHELVWLKDPFDAFVLHVQGSGLIRLRDGSVKGVHYAAKNGRPYRSIGKHLVKTGRLDLSEANLDSIRAYIAAHPEERDEILHHNESFIFFSWSETQAAFGNLGQELTAGRSIAVDQSCFPPGGLAFLVTRKPTRTGEGRVLWSPLQRFVLVQDTGSAIRGAGRVDLFWGAGPAAGSEAGLMKETGSLYFLILKDTVLAKLPS